VAHQYIKGGLAFDVITSFPVSFFEMSAMNDCLVHPDSAGVDSGQLRFIRAIKPLRWFKLARIMKLGKSAAIANFFMDYFNISPRAGRGVKVVLSLLAFIHIAGCMMWLIKVLIEDEHAVYAFLDNLRWLNDEHYDLQTTRGKADAYVVCIYFVTVGTLRTHTHTHAHTHARRICRVYLLGYCRYRSSLFRS